MLTGSFKDNPGLALDSNNIDVIYYHHNEKIFHITRNKEVYEINFTALLEEIVNSTSSNIPCYIHTSFSDISLLDESIQEYDLYRQYFKKLDNGRTLYILERE